MSRNKKRKQVQVTERKSEQHVLKGDISTSAISEKVGHLITEVEGVAEANKEHLLAEVFARRFNQLAMNTYPQHNLLASVVAHDPREVKVLYKSEVVGSWKPEPLEEVPGPVLQPAPGPLVQEPVAVVEKEPAPEPEDVYVPPANDEVDKGVLLHGDKPPVDSTGRIDGVEQKPAAEPAPLPVTGVQDSGEGTAPNPVTDPALNAIDGANKVDQAAADQGAPAETAQQPAGGTSDQASDERELTEEEKAAKATAEQQQ